MQVHKGIKWLHEIQLRYVYQTELGNVTTDM